MNQQSVDESGPCGERPGCSPPVTDRTWDLFVELRKELVESQRIRAQVIGFKITFITAAVVLIAAEMGPLGARFLAAPAFAAVFFDFLICSYGFSIKRIGFYIRVHLEPELKNGRHLPKDLLLWQAYLTDDRTRQRLSFYGHLGLTVLMVLLGSLGLWLDGGIKIAAPLLAALWVLTSIDIVAYRSTEQFGNRWRE